MDWTHLKPADARLMPWKNGGGMTPELALDPPGATLETGFRWRLSSAEVGVSGPFSIFQGLDRLLLLLEGRGLSLDFGSRGTVELSEPFLPIRFSGDWPATATLVEGPCTDLNLKVDPTRCRASVRGYPQVVTGRVTLSAATTLLFVARGTLCIPEFDLHLGPRHTVRVDGGGGAIQLIPGYGGAALVLAELDGV
jgi:environmental stress-induced protein Ves